jgi:predicted CoA-binding protein
MSPVHAGIADFLRGRRIAVAGVSRQPGQAANAIFRKLRDSGYDAIPVNPLATELEHATCYPDVSTIPGGVDGVVVATPPAAALDVVRQAARAGVRQIWFHRSFGQGSVDDDAVREARALGLTCIVGGCPLMFCAPDVGHRCMRWWLEWRGRIG